MEEKEIALFFTAAALAFQNNDERALIRARAIMTGKSDPYPNDQDIYYSVEEMAKMIGCSERTIKRQMDLNELKSFRIGERRMTTKKDWNEFIMKRKIS